LINVTETKASNFKKEIVAANVEKHKALLKTVCDDLESISSRESQNMIKLKESIHNFQENVKGDFAASKNRIKGLSDRKYNSIFDQIYQKVVYAIDNDISDPKVYCESNSKRIIKKVSKDITKEISKEIESLNKNIDRRKHSLDQAVSYIGSDGANLEINVSLSFDDALKKLDFNFDDIAHYATAAIGAAFVAANFWNPVGIGLAIATVLLSFFTGRSKKAQAKAKAYEEIYKAKKENKQKFDSAISKICTKLNKSRDQIVKSVGVDGTNVESLKGEVTDVIGKLKIEISKLNIM
jgi:ElaB/YqjD/DUF883 family membrane-anchored ribosome-binding protein